MLQIGGTFFGTCSTAGSQTNKVVSDCPGFVLYSGASIYVKFDETNTASASLLTLNINNTGAKSIKCYGTTNLPNNSILAAGLICNFVYDGTNWQYVGQIIEDTNTVPSAYCTTSSDNSEKTATCNNFHLADNSYVHVLFALSNSSPGAITLNINNTGAYPIYINGARSSQTNYTLPAGTYLAYFDGVNYQIRTDGKLHGTMTGNVVSITNNGSTIYYVKGDGTTSSFTVPHTEYTGGSSIKIENNVISNMGVRAVSMGDNNGTIKVNTGNVTQEVSVKGLGSAAYSNTAEFATAAHSHGNIDSSGTIDGTNETVATGDSILITDSSDSDRLVKSALLFDTSATNKYLSQNGTWETVVATITQYAEQSATAEWSLDGQHAIYSDQANFSGTATYAIEANKAIRDGNNNVITDTYVTITSLNQALAGTDAMVFKGTLGTNGTITTVPIQEYNAGDTYKIVTAGTYAGNVCEVGDLLIAIANGPNLGSSVINADWTVAQTNIDGAVTGTVASTSGALAIFSNTTGKAIAQAYAKGAADSPIYIDINGYPQIITSYKGKAGSANYATNAFYSEEAKSAGSAGYALLAENANEAIHAVTAAFAAEAGEANIANSAMSAASATWATYAAHSNSASYAATADYAGYALNADYATYAETAHYADSAAFAVTAIWAVGAEEANLAQNAIYSSSAYYATQATNSVNASHANDAKYASSANYALTADEATYASSANFATNATNANFATNATNADKAKSAGSAGYAIYANSASFATTAKGADSANYAKIAGSANFATSAIFATNSNYANLNGIEYIVGTQTIATNIWTGQTRDSELYVGKTIAYKLPFAGTSNAALLELTFADGSSKTGQKAVIVNNNVGVTTHYPANSLIVMTYDGSAWRTQGQWNTTYSKMSIAERDGATATTARLISADILAGANVACANYAIEAAHATSATYVATAENAIHAATATFAAEAGEANIANSANLAGTAAWAIGASRANCATYVTTAQHAIHATSATYALNDADGNEISTTYIKSIEFEHQLTVAEALRFKGTLGLPINGGTVQSLPDEHSAGDTYKVVTAGTLGGIEYRPGDLIICIEDGTTHNDADWTVVQANMDGVMTGPSSSIDGQVAVFNGIGGNVIRAVTPTTVDVIKTLDFTPNDIPTLGDPITASYVTEFIPNKTVELGTAIPADDITSWVPNSITTATVNGGVLIFYAGTTATLAWADRDIPNVTHVGTTATLAQTIKAIPNILTTGTTATLSTTAVNVIRTISSTATNGT